MRGVSRKITIRASVFPDPALSKRRSGEDLEQNVERLAAQALANAGDCLGFVEMGGSLPQVAEELQELQMHQGELGKALLVLCRLRSA